MRARELIGKGVVTTDGFLLGKVSDLIIDLGEWRVVELVVSLSGQAARQLSLKKFIGSPKVALPVGHVSGIRDVISLSADTASLKSALREV